METNGQELFYSPVETGADQFLKHKTIGRIGKNILISRERKRKHYVSVFDNNMNLIREVELNILPKNIVDVDYINAGNKTHIIFQFLEKNTLFAGYTSLDENGKITNEVTKLDSTLVDNIRDFPIYQVIVNTSKSMFMLLYIHQTEELITKLTTKLYNNTIEKLDQSTLLVSTPEGNENLKQFQLDNEGNLIFLHNLSSAESNNFYTRTDILIKLKGVNEVKNATIQSGKIWLKDLKIAIDNVNSRVIAGSVFYGSKKFIAQGIFTLMIDVKTGNASNWKQEFYSDSLKKELQNKITPRKKTFDEYDLDEIIPYTNGGFALIMEQRITEGSKGIISSNQSFIAEPLSPRVIYNGSTDEGAIFNVIRTPYQAFQIPIESSSRSLIRNIAGNMLIFSLNKENQLIDVQVLRKEQDENRTSNTISYALMKSTGAIKLLYNEKDKNELSLRSANFIPGSRIKRNPAIKGSISNFRFLPRYATQIGSNECIIPCLKMNFGSFARIVF